MNRMLELNMLLNEVDAPKVFTIDNVDVFKRDLQAGLQKLVPYVQVGHSTLGGPSNISCSIHISFEDSKDWTNNIYQNSRHAIFYITNTGACEKNTISYKIEAKYRKIKFKNAKDLVSKLGKWIAKVN